MTCHTAIMETIATWSKSVHGLAVIRMPAPPSPVFLEMPSMLDQNPGTRCISIMGTAGVSAGSWNQAASCPWRTCVFHCHGSFLSPSSAVGGGSCQNKPGQFPRQEAPSVQAASLPFASLCAFAFISVRVERSHWGPGVRHPELSPHTGALGLYAATP